jgi:hypothetical protein
MLHSAPAGLCRRHRRVAPHRRAAPQPEGPAQRAGKRIACLVPGCCDTGGPSPARNGARRRILRADGQVKLQGGVAVTQDDLLYRFRPRVFAIAAELGTVRAACQAMGIHPSTYHRWKRQLDRHTPEILAQGPGATCRCRRLNGRGCAFSSPARSLTWPRPSMPATGRWCSSAPTAACGSGLKQYRSVLSPQSTGELRTTAGGADTGDWMQPQVPRPPTP